MLGCFFTTNPHWYYFGSSIINFIHECNLRSLIIYCTHCCLLRSSVFILLKNLIVWCSFRRFFIYWFHFFNLVFFLICILVYKFLVYFIIWNKIYFTAHQIWIIFNFAFFYLWVQFRWLKIINRIYLLVLRLLSFLKLFFFKSKRHLVIKIIFKVFHKIVQNIVLNNNI